MTDHNHKTSRDLDKELADFTDQVLTPGAAQTLSDGDPELVELQETVLLLKEVSEEAGVSKEAAARVRRRLLRRMQQEMPERTNPWMDLAATLRQNLGVLIGAVVVVALAIALMIVQPGSLPGELPATATGGSGWVIWLVCGILSVIVIILLWRRSRK